MFFRTLCFALIAISLVLAAMMLMPLVGVAPLWTPSGEPERLARQLAPEKIQILPPGTQSRPEASAPSAAASEVAQSEPTAAPASADHNAEQETPVVAAEPAASKPVIQVEEHRCIALKGLTEELLHEAAVAAKREGNELRLKESNVVATTYWVNIPPSGGKEAAEKRVEVLQNAGVTDYYIVREAGPNQFAVSLGLFRAEDLAKKRLESLKKLDIATARITPRENASARLEVSGPNSLVEQFVGDFAKSHKSHTLARDNCHG